MAAFTLRWGIIATGGISTQFTSDLVLDSSARNAGDIKHVVKAVGSRSKESADKFISKVIPCESQSQVAGGTYEQVYANQEVDVVYIGTPHTYHYDNTKDALNAGKHVLCEKPFTFDTEELDELLALAKEKNLFLMEAVWTRFHPIAYAVQEVVFSGKYGKTKRMLADLSFNMKVDDRDPETDRMIAAHLGGGGLLDLGPYPMVWAMMLLHQNPANKSHSPPSSITGHMIPYERTGVDLNSNWVVEWKGVGTAICRTSMETETSPRGCVHLEMEEAEIVIDTPTYRPEGFTIYPRPTESNPKPEAIVKKCPIPEAAGRGMNYQADEVARCIRDKKLESDRCNHAESRVVMTVFDEVRKQGNYCGGNVRGKAGGK